MFLEKGSREDGGGIAAWIAVKNLSDNNNEHMDRWEAWLEPQLNLDIGVHSWARATTISMASRAVRPFIPSCGAAAAAAAAPAAAAAAAALSLAAAMPQRQWQRARR